MQSSKTNPVLDESDNPTLHRFLSFCRLLMVQHPRVGAHSYDIFLGNSPYRLGWNAIHRSKSQIPHEPDTMYMWVSKEGGYLTPNKPECSEEEISHFSEDDLPDVRRTSAWRQMETLAELLIKQDNPRFSPDRVSSIMANIQKISLRAPLRGDDGTIQRLFDSARQHMKSVVDALQDSIPLHDFLRPAYDIVERYLAFELCGMYAANALSLILNLYCMHIPSPLSNGSPVKRVWDCSRHLVARTYDLLKGRNSLNLTSFYDATYLAFLYGETAVLGYKFLLHSKLPTKEEMKLIARESFAIDEKLAHEAAPTLRHPILLMPFGIIEWMLRARFAIGDTAGLYPGALDNVNIGLDFEATIQSIRRYSSKAKAVAIADTVENENSPVSEELKQHLTAFLFTMGIGKQVP